MLQENSPFLYDYVSLLLLENVKEKKLSKMSQGCVRIVRMSIKNSNAFLQEGMDANFQWWPSVFFTTNQFPKLRLHSRPRMQNCTCDVILGWPEFLNSAVLCMLHSVYDTALE